MFRIRWRIEGRAAPVRETVRVAEALRAALFRAAGEGALAPAELHHGGAEGAHLHAFYLPLDTDDDGWLDMAEIIIPGGAGEAARRLLLSLEHIRIGGRGRFSLRRAGKPGLKPALRWRTATPFFGPRNAFKKARRKLKAGETAERQLMRELGRYRQPTGEALPPATVTEVEGPCAASAFRPNMRALKGPAAPVCGWFEIDFAEPAIAPPASGFAAHFGLGRFEPAGNAAREGGIPGGVVPLKNQ